jgi:hypothetical protein
MPIRSCSTTCFSTATGTTSEARSDANRTCHHHAQLAARRSIASLASSSERTITSSSRYPYASSPPGSEGASFGRSSRYSDPDREIRLGPASRNGDERRPPGRTRHKEFDLLKLLWQARDRSCREQIMRGNAPASFGVTAPLPSERAGTMVRCRGSRTGCGSRSA